MSMWYEKYGRDQDVVLSSKAFIVRNVKGYNFTKKMSEGDFGSLTEQVDAAVDKSVTGKLWSAGALSSGTEDDDSLLTPESQLFGKNMYIIKNPDHKRIYYNDDAGLSIVLGSTEHITIRAMASGNDPSVYAKAESIAVGLEKKLDMAYSDKFGFLTSDIKLTGTGLSREPRSFSVLPGQPVENDVAFAEFTICDALLCVCTFEKREIGLTKWSLLEAL